MLSYQYFSYSTLIFTPQVGDPMMTGGQLMVPQRWLELLLIGELLRVDRGRDPSLYGHPGMEEKVGRSVQIILEFVFYLDADSCNCDGYTNSIHTLSISSATERGNIPWWNNFSRETTQFFDFLGIPRRAAPHWQLHIPAELLESGWLLPLICIIPVQNLTRALQPPPHWLLALPHWRWKQTQI